MDSLGEKMDNLAMAFHHNMAARRLRDALDLRISGHFHDMPQHYMKREKPVDYLLWMVTSGRGWVREAGSRMEMGPGDLSMLRPGVPQEYAADPGEPWDIYWFHFGGELAEEYASLLRRGAGPVTHAGVEPAICQRMAALVQLHEAMGRDAVLPHGEFHGILAGLVQLALHTSTRGVPMTALDHAGIDDYIHHHLAAPLTLDDLARRTHLSVTQFSRLFRQRHRMSPMQYLIRARMIRAAALLRETRSKVQAIAAAVGYEDPYYFSRLFRKTMGQSPARYRASVDRRE